MGHHQGWPTPLESAVPLLQDRSTGVTAHAPHFKDSLCGCRKTGLVSIRKLCVNFLLDLDHADQYQSDNCYGTLFQYYFNDIYCAVTDLTGGLLCHLVGI